MKIRRTFPLGPFMPIGASCMAGYVALGHSPLSIIRRNPSYPIPVRGFNYIISDYRMNIKTTCKVSKVTNETSLWQLWHFVFFVKKSKIKKENDEQCRNVTNKK